MKSGEVNPSSQVYSVDSGKRSVILQSRVTLRYVAVLIQDSGSPVVRSDNGLQQMQEM